MHDRLAFFIDGAWSTGDGKRSGAVLNPATGEKIQIAASKKLTFAAAKALKDKVNG